MLIIPIMSNAEWKRAVDAVQWAFASVAPLLPLVEEMMRAAQPAIDATQEFTWRNYRLAGMPYGDTSEGLGRWLNDLVSRAR